MNPYLVAGLIVAGLVTLGTAASVAAERKAKRILDTPHVCGSCQRTPVLARDAWCNGCKAAQRVAATITVRVYWTCALCHVQRVNTPHDICGVCLHEVHEELDNWVAP